MRGSAEKFADHYTQARLFWHSQTPVEQQHIVNAFRFELSRVQTPAVRERMISGLRNVAPELAEPVANGLGMRVLPEPMPKARPEDVRPEVTTSTSLSLFARPGDGGIRTRRVAVLVADGCDAAPLRALVTRLTAEGAVARFVAGRLGTVDTTSGDPIEADVSFEATPSVLYDAVVIAGGEAAVVALAGDGHAKEFVKDQYRHCKPILAIDDGVDLLTAAGIPLTLPSGDPDPGLIRSATDGAALVDAFVAALAKHRHFARETNPPRV